MKGGGKKNLTFESFTVGGKWGVVTVKGEKDTTTCTSRTVKITDRRRYTKTTKKESNSNGEGLRTRKTNIYDDKKRKETNKGEVGNSH